jgi:hypothetical protein
MSRNCMTRTSQQECRGILEFLCEKMNDMVMWNVFQINYKSIL